MLDVLIPTEFASPIAIGLLPGHVSDQPSPHIDGDFLVFKLPTAIGAWGIAKCSERLDKYRYSLFVMRNTWRPVIARIGRMLIWPPCPLKISSGIRNAIMIMWIASP